MEVTLSRLVRDWFDEHELRNQFIAEYPGRDSLIVRHQPSCKMVILIFQRDIMLAYFQWPVQLKITDPHLFYKLDQALRKFAESI